jgi:hypothetical protein
MSILKCLRVTKIAITNSNTTIPTPCKHSRIEYLRRGSVYLDVIIPKYNEVNKIVNEAAPTDRYNGENEILLLMYSTLNNHIHEQNKYNGQGGKGINILLSYIYLCYNIIY